MKLTELRGELGPAKLWLQRLSPAADRSIRLVCFPYAGGSATVFRRWPAGLSPAVEVLAVQYPGRGSRLSEAPIDRVQTTARAVADALADLPLLPTVFFGHSLGGAVAFEVVRCLADDGAPLPNHLFVSSRSAPHLVSPRPPITHLSDVDFLREVGRRYAAVPPQLLEYPDVLALLVPGLRADMAAIEHYEGTVAEPVGCALTVFGGSDDPTTPRDHLEAWRELTMKEFRLRIFPGDHFYLETQQQLLLEDVAAMLAAMGAGVRADGVA